MIYTSKLREFLDEYRAQRGFSGAAYAVGTSKKLVEQGYVGTLSWDGPLVTRNSRWDLASVTKPIVALGVMGLLENGALKLSDSVGHFLPEYRGTDKQDLTVRQLLTHSSGIPGQQPLYKQTSSKSELLQLVRNLPLSFAPDTNVAYTSQGFMILGMIAEHAAGEQLDKLLQRTVFDPLGMSDTGFNPPPEVAKECVATEQCEWRGVLVQGQVHDENAAVLGGVAGHAGLFSTLNDLTRLCTAILSHGQGHYQHDGFLTQSTIQKMTSCYTRALPLARCLGWQGYDADGSPAGDLFSADSYGHTGFTGTSVWMDPVYDRFVVLLTNRVHPTRENTLMERIRPLFHNLAVQSLEYRKAKEGLY